MSSIWQDLFVNFAIACLCISVWRHFRHSIGSVGLAWRRIVFGTMMGLGAVSTMYLSIQVADGVIFDLRNSLVVVAAGFGGPIGGLVAALIAGAYRFWLGGVGLSAGLSGIALSAALGLVVNISRIGRRTNYWHVLTMAVGASLAFFVATASLPFGFGTDAFMPISAPVGTMLFLATFAMGSFLLSAQNSARDRDLLRAATTQSPDYRYIKDTASRFVATNLATAKINGFKSIRGIIGKTDLDLDHSERAVRLFEVEQDLMRKGESRLSFEEKIDGENGPRWFSSSKVPLRSPDGVIIGMVGVTTDITEKKLLENSLAQAKNRLAFALSEMSDGLAMFDDEGRLLFCNERYLDMFPMTAHVRQPGTKLVDILKEVVKTGEQDIPTLEEPELWIDTIVENLGLNTEEQTHMSDGRWLSIRTRTTKNGHTMVLVSDITQSKFAEMELIRSTERLRALAETDGLTGLSNRRSFDSVLEIGMLKAQENRSKLSLLMIDVDHFKSYNDTLGHAAGDACLKQIASLLQSCVTRSVDLVARYGGEEFALVLIGTDIDGAILVGDRVRETLLLANLPHEASPLGRVSISMGAASNLHSEDTPADLIKRADKALYAAKEAGRDRMEVWQKDENRNVG